MLPLQIRVQTNSFAITQLPKRDYYMYDVIMPEVKEPPKRKQLIHHLQITVAPQIFNPRMIYDGRAIAYAPGKINFGGNAGASFNIILGKPTQQAPGGRGVHTIRINITSSPPIAPGDVNDIIKNGRVTERSMVATNLMQMVMRQGPNQHHTNNGRAYFTRKEHQAISGAGVELWRGIFQSVRPTMGKMVLTIDTSTAAVYKSGRLIDVCMDFLQLRNVRDLNMDPQSPNFRKLEKFLKKLKVKVVTGVSGSRSRVKTIRGLEPAAGHFSFDKEDGGSIRVAAHFEQTYGIRIQYPDIVGVRLAGKNSPFQDIVPAELCTIEDGQLYRQKLSETVTAAMVKFSTMKPGDRLKKIVTGAEDYHKSEYVQESGMIVDTRPLTIPASILPTPGVEYGNNNQIRVSGGGWNVLGKKLLLPTNLQHWAVVNFLPGGLNQEALHKIVNGLMDSCRALGMGVSNPYDVFPAHGNDAFTSLDRVMDNIKRMVKTNASDPEDSKAVGRQLSKTVLIILLPQNAAAIRTAVKMWGDINNGLITQCLRQNKIERGGNNQYWNNVVLKLNARLGGINSRTISPTMKMLKESPFIIMGADVGHPGPGVQKPSVTSLVYSHDRDATQYASLTSIQEPRTEIIADLHTFISDAIASWGIKNKCSPNRIIFFRDGVSEGEFDKVAEQEIKVIHAAINDLWTARNIPDKKPMLTFIVVGKRHHAVFFPTDGNKDPKTGNCLAGSVFDKEITHPAYKDFYLQSHSAIQGTCRSSRYIVLHDENQMPPSAIQELAYSLCHVYAKATRSVSIPAPVYYADLVCSRGLFHIDRNSTLNFDDGMSTSSGQNEFDLESWKSAFRPTNQRMDKSMYFL